MRLRYLKNVGLAGIVLGIMLAACGKGKAVDLTQNPDLKDSVDAYTLNADSAELERIKIQLGVSYTEVVPVSSAELSSSSDLMGSSSSGFIFPLSSISLSSSEMPLSFGLSSTLPISSSVIVIGSSNGLSSSSTPIINPSSVTPSSSAIVFPSSSSIIVILPSSSSGIVIIPSSSSTAIVSSAVIVSSSAAVISSSAVAGTPLAFTYGGTAQAMTPGVTYSISFTEVRGQLTCIGSGTITATIGGTTATDVVVNTWQTAVVQVTAATGTAKAAAGSSMTCKQDW